MCYETVQKHCSRQSVDKETALDWNDSDKVFLGEG